MKRLFVLAMILALIIMSSASNLIWPVAATSDSRSSQIPNGLEMIESTTSRSSSVYKTIILQGNTENALDCQAFENALRNTGFGYTTFARGGWVITSSEPLENRATEAQFKYAYNFDVAYYSGHGSKSTGYPVLNAIPSNSSANYGTSSPINVATALGVASDSNWENECYFSESDPIRVLILAACDQLDSSIVKYYVRIMKASGIRAIAGYHGTAPSIGDDTIANNFVSLAAAGNSVKYAWSNANSGNNWAILVYRENSNEYYRLPGFPGNTYTTPSDSASVYRFASFLTEPREETTSIGSNPVDLASSLPLTITADMAESPYVEYNIESPEGVYNSRISHYDDSLLASNYVSATYGEDVLSSMVCVQHYVSCVEVDEDSGVLEDTEAIVERTFDYYDTYNGIKVLDSFISIKIDADGIESVQNHRVNIIGESASVNACMSNATTMNPIISEYDAIESALSQVCSCCEVDVYNVSLAYIPTDNYTYTLSYEVMLSCGIYYVDIFTAEIIPYV